MNMFRTMGLLCAAFLTMGSGGVSKANDDQTPATTLEPEYVDTDPAAATASAEEPADDLVSAASTDAAASPPALPASASQMAGSEGRAIELSLSDDYIQGRYYTGGGILGFDDTVGHVGVYLSDERDIIGNVGIMTEPVSLFVPGLSLSAGARGYVALLADPADDVVGLAPGIQGRYGLPYDFPLAIVGNIFYSPDILTLGDAENIIDIDARVEAEVIPDVVGFIGIREFRFDSDVGSDKKAAEEIQVGARFAL